MVYLYTSGGYHYVNTCGLTQGLIFTQLSKKKQMATVESKNDWLGMVRKLRCDQKLLSCQLDLVREQHYRLNDVCEQYLQALWVNHILGFGLNRVLAHRLAPGEWVTALDAAPSVRYTDLSQVLSSNSNESYSRFLTNLQQDPSVVAEVLQWAGREGLDTSRLASDLMSVVFSHCVFPDDHRQLLKVLSCLLSSHVESCSSHKDLFGIEPVFSRIVSEYCQQVPELKVFFTRVVSQPMLNVIEFNTGYLEFDVSKAGNRLQDEQNCNIPEYINRSSSKLAEFCMFFLRQLDTHKALFPSSLKWLLGLLKALIRKKWPTISPDNLRRPISYVFFGFILSAAFVNPDLCGVLDYRIVVNEQSWYNMSQVIGILQGCAWIVNRLNSSDYPMTKVVKLMDMVCFVVKVL